MCECLQGLTVGVMKTIVNGWLDMMFTNPEPSRPPSINQEDYVAGWESPPYKPAPQRRGQELWEATFPERRKSHVGLRFRLSGNFAVLCSTSQQPAMNNRNDLQSSFEPYGDTLGDNRPQILDKLSRRGSKVQMTAPITELVKPWWSLNVWRVSEFHSATDVFLRAVSIAPEFTSSLTSRQCVLTVRRAFSLNLSQYK